MRIEQLSVHKFRNLESTELRFPHRVSFVIGKNGQGKTNLLESIFLLSQAKSFRSSSHKELLSWSGQDEQSTCCVDAQIHTEESGTRYIKIELGQGSRKVYVNDKKVSKASRFYGQFRSVVFTPDDLQIAKGSPSIRRQFIDRTLALVDEAFVDASVAYEKALKSRNALLKEEPSAEALSMWNSMLVNHGEVVAKRRQAFVGQLKEAFSHYYQELLGGQRNEKVRLTYKSDFCENEGILEKSALMKVFEDTTARDRARKLTSKGIQKDDLLIEIDTGGGFFEARSIASQGQARSIVLALKLAAVDFLSKQSDEPPVVLLDDIDSELDKERREALFKLVYSSKSQVFVSLTELPEEALKLDEQHSVFRISQGQISSS